MKLQRAEEHFGDLRLEQLQFLARNPYRMLREHDLGKGERHYLWRAKIVEHPPYEKWASLIGESAHALRSALEHTAYALVNTPTFVTDKTAFPILDEAGKWSSAHPKDLPGVKPDVLTEVEGLQPYKRFKDRDPLWVVHLLDIIDKHRRLHLVDATVQGTYWKAVRGTLTPTEGGVGPFKDGAVVGRFSLVPDADSGMEMETQFEFGIAMGEGEPGEGTPALSLLEYLRSYVGGVVARFEQFF
jgi:hypothetical protein